MRVASLTFAYLCNLISNLMFLLNLVILHSEVTLVTKLSYRPSCGYKCSQIRARDWYFIPSLSVNICLDQSNVHLYEEVWGNLQRPQGLVWPHGEWHAEAEVRRCRSAKCGSAGCGAEASGAAADTAIIVVGCMW